MVEKIRPLLDRVLVQRIEQQKKTESGIIIPDAAKEKTHTGKVLAIGPGKLVDGKTIPMNVKVGDLVFLPKYAGTEAGKEHIIIKEDEILGVIDN